MKQSNSIQIKPTIHNQYQRYLISYKLENLTMVKYESYKEKCNVNLENKEDFCDDDHLKCNIESLKFTLRINEFYSQLIIQLNRYLQTYLQNDQINQKLMECFDKQFKTGLKEKLIQGKLKNHSLYDYGEKFITSVCKQKQISFPLIMQDKKRQKKEIVMEAFRRNQVFFLASSLISVQIKQIY